MPSFNGNILLKGDIIDNTYEVSFFIGQGAFGEVYLVKHRFMDLQVMKVFKEDYVNKTDIGTVTKEAKILSKLTHPNIVRVFETNFFRRAEKRYFFMTMGFVSGETLTQLLGRKIKVPLDLALSIQRDILSGLKFVQDQVPPIVHRDISADNVLLSYDKEQAVALISDFGLAQSIDQLSKFPEAAGRYIYLAPECFFGTYLPASDVFSAGVIFYKMITGMYPWEYDFDGCIGDAEEIATMVIKARRKQVQKPSFYNNDCDSSLDQVILKAISLDIEQRHKTAGELLNDLYNFGR